MNPEPIEVPPDPVTEPQQQEPQQQEAAQPEQDFYKFKVRGLQREIPAQDTERFAGYLGWKPDALVNRLQMATDAERVYAQLKREREEFEQERQGWIEAQQRQEQERSQRLQGHAPQPDQEDPLSYLRTIPAMAEELRTIKQEMAQERQAFAQELRKEREQQVLQEIEGSYESFIESKRSKNPKAPAYDLDTLIETAEFLGIDTVRNPVPRILEAAYRYLAAEELPQQAVEEQMRKLRDPRAQVVVPGSASTNAPPPPADPRTQLAQDLAGMKWGQGIEFLPERR